MIKVYLLPCPLIYKTSLGFTQSQLRHGLLTSFLPCTQVSKDSLIPPLLEVGGQMHSYLPSSSGWQGPGQSLRLKVTAGNVGDRFSLWNHLSPNLNLSLWSDPMKVFNVTQLGPERCPGHPETLLWETLPKACGSAWSPPDSCRDPHPLTLASI